MSIPAAFAFWASTWQASTIPAAIGEVTSSTLRPDLPAALSSDFARSMSCCRL